MSDAVRWLQRVYDLLMGVSRDKGEVHLYGSAWHSDGVGWSIGTRATIKSLYDRPSDSLFHRVYFYTHTLSLSLDCDIDVPSLVHVSL